MPALLLRRTVVAAGTAAATVGAAVVVSWLAVWRIGREPWGDSLWYH